MVLDTRKLEPAATETLSTSLPPKPPVKKQASGLGMNEQSPRKKRAHNDDSSDGGENDEKTGKYEPVRTKKRNRSLSNMDKNERKGSKRNLNTEDGNQTADK